MSRINTLLRSGLPLLVLLVPESAHAHLVSTRFGEFYSGLLHPLTTLVHLVPWLALAMFASMQGKAFARRSLPLFPLAVAFGVLLGISFGGLQSLLIPNILSFVVLGGLVALSYPLPRAVGLTAVVLFAISHGYANGDVDLADGSLTLYVAGVTTAAYLVVALGAGAAVAISERAAWGQIALRALGSWILAAGLIYGGFELMGVRGA
ncbi:HupE/UreJ family protein [Candidatus Thiodiazotropha endoloripes]|uniref:Urease accessory protein UreJ n=1 Tax=Candidatus Thiodiazotropha endoloripes TaxID=1818881 RepID=A0A1E2UTG7_9GAMM|nr:HupE/UreJ family protein [Candidatus Thiodiazotropha endoloripes]ODB97971.1 hypothetical protein A3196_15100 [Candidatus Thiodiazotropha endoloripes]